MLNHCATDTWKSYKIAFQSNLQFSCVFSITKYLRCYGTQFNDIQYNDTLRNNTQNKSFLSAIMLSDVVLSVVVFIINGQAY